MALEIGNDTFNMFVNFANRYGAESKTVAMIGTDTLGGRTIEANHGDNVGKLFRSGTAKTANNDVRALFKSAVEDMFGGALHVPDSVRKMMLEGDYYKGKPLTARRILAVKSAIDLVKTDYNTAVDKAMADLMKDSKFKTRPAGDRPVIEAAVCAAVKASMGNKAALESVMKNMQFIVMDGARNIRTPESVTKKCDAIVANFQELQSLAKGSKAFAAAGAALLDELHGKALPPGVIGKIAAMCNKADISVIKGLSEKSPSVDFDRAAKQFWQGIQKVMVDSGAEKVLKDGDELEPCRNFAAALLAGRLGSSGLGKLDRALNSEGAQQLVSLYNTISDGNFDKDDLKAAQIEATKVEAGARLKFLNTLKFAGDVSRGVDVKDATPVEEFRGDFDYGKMNAGAILLDIIDAGKAQVVTDRDNYISSVVRGDGNGAKLLRGIYEKKLGPTPFGPKDTINTSGAAVASSMMNITICGECRKLALGQQSSFEKDIGRQNVTLGNGEKLSKDFAEAREQLSRFVSGNPNAKYAELDPKTRNKVHLAMALLNQETDKAVFEGFPAGLDPDMKDALFVVMVSTEPGAKDSREFVFEIDPDGGFDLKLKGEKDIAVFADGKHSTMLGQGSNVVGTLTYALYGSEVDRLSSLDFSKLDETGSRKTFEDKTLAHRFELAPKQFAPEFQISSSKMTCKVGYIATLN